MITKSQLSIQLSYLKAFTEQKIKEEQYSTDSEIASIMLWNAFMLKDIEGKTIADLGAGTGILGIGALHLEAKKIFFVEKDADVISLLQENLKKSKCSKKKYEIINKDISFFEKSCDTIIMNPPFGTKQKHADKVFLEKAYTLAPVIYSIHKAATKAFLEKNALSHRYTMTHYWEHQFPLKKTLSFHTKRIEKISICICRFEKQKTCEK